MTAVLTGDIVNSKELISQKWQKALEGVLTQYGQTPSAWQIYRGDSFQLEISPFKALEAAIHLKAAIKQFQKLDVRIAIGIGEKTYTSSNITQSNGSAFINSGECFDALKKNNLAIRTPDKRVNKELNMYFDLALLTMDRWPIKTAKIVKAAIENPDDSQKVLTNKLHLRSQSTVSQSLKASGFHEIMKMNIRYQLLIT